MYERWEREASTREGSDIFEGHVRAVVDAWSGHVCKAHTEGRPARTFAHLQPQNTNLPNKEDRLWQGCSYAGINTSVVAVDSARHSLTTYHNGDEHTIFSPLLPRQSKSTLALSSSTSDRDISGYRIQGPTQGARLWYTFKAGHTEHATWLLR